MSRRSLTAILAVHVAILAGRAAGGDDQGSREPPASSYPVLSGVGVALSIEDAGPRIAKVVPGSAAERSGRLKDGDRILTIRNGGETVVVRGKKLGEVVSLIRGPVGTTVTLEVAREEGKPGLLVTLK